ncbi:hypothetical protein VNO78_06482 [Psophocarpus tetragonolobus]|uniref:Uncharacterized protein n=1 Tax=Psophocarpus tetragonolobus TaxID=3891 RepID=A0AAN9T262_PSOTE
MVSSSSSEKSNSSSLPFEGTSFQMLRKDLGYIPKDLNRGVVLHDINEEMKAICGHSEWLVAVFALIHIAVGMPIRIT